MRWGLVSLSVLFVATCRGDRAEPELLDGKTLADRDPAALSAIQAGMATVVNPRIADCARLWTERGLAPDVEWVDLRLRIAVRSSGDRAKIGRWDRTRWPKPFDAEMRRCVEAALGAGEFASGHTFDYVVEYPVQITVAPPEERGGEVEGPEQREQEAPELQAIQEGLTLVAQPVAAACVQAAVSREALKSDELRLELDLAIAAREGVATVTWTADPTWPDEADDELRRCVRDAFHGATFGAGQAFEERIRYPLRIRIE